MRTETPKPDDPVRHRKPPTATRFKKGQSGNPKGRPKGRRSQAPYDAVLGRIVSVNEGGVERRLTAAEAFLLYMLKRSLDGDQAAARSIMALLGEARTARGAEVPLSFTIDIGSMQPKNVDSALELLRMAAKLDRYRPSARMALELWLVSEALSRMGDRRFSLDEQATIVQATRTPKKVRWPQWWQFRP